MSQFLGNAEMNLVRDWSLKRKADSFTYIPFHTHPQLQLRHWTNAWQWSSLGKDITRYKKDGRDCYCIPGGLEKSLSVKDCTKYFNLINQKSWANFDEYTKHV